MAKFLALTSLAVLAAAPAAADENAVAGRLGALGLGVEYTHDFNARLSLRAGLNGSDIGFDATESGIDYEFEFAWDSLAVGVDFHPLGTPLRVSAGLLSNDNELSAVSRTSGDVTIGGETYTSEQVGSLTASVGFDSTAPYAGVGWDWSRKSGLVGVSFDLGVVSQGAPVVNLTADGGLVDDAMFEQDIRAEERELQEALEDFDLLPYASLGVVFRF